MKFQWSTPTNKLFCDASSLNAKKAFSNLAVDFVNSPLNADLIWVREHYLELQNKLKPHQALNYIPKEEILTKKGDFALALHAYDNSLLRLADVYTCQDFFLPTYCLFDPSERASFLRQLPDSNHHENLWILKPSGLSQGEGIRILWQFDALKNELRDTKKSTLEFQGKQLDYVIQKYLKNILLIEKKKSDIRVYWAIASLDPLIVLFYKEGVVHIASQPYSLDRFDDPHIHLTRTTDQPLQQLDSTVKNRTWSFSQLQNYLSNERGISFDFVESKLLPQIKQSLIYSIRACQDTLKQTPPNGLYFGLYAADFLIDTSLKPWLIEIQRGPSLRYDDPVKEHIIPPMLQELARVIFEIQERKRQAKSLQNLTSIKNFELIIHD